MNHENSANSEEYASLVRCTHWDTERGSPTVVPGSFEEEEALRRIDEARDEELAAIADTAEDRAKRLQRYWRRHARD
jgi:hypothetical protein